MKIYKAAIIGLGPSGLAVNKILYGDNHNEIIAFESEDINKRDNIFGFWLTDEIEIKGIEITKSKILKSSVLIYLFDINDTNEKEILKDLEEFYSNDLKIILVRNKIDLKSKTKINIDSFKKYKITSLLEISAIDKESVSIVRDNLSNEFGIDSSNSDIVVTNLRHYNALSDSINFIEKVREAIENEVPGDLLSIDLRNVIDTVGEITGEISNDEMLGNIFSNFCIGK